MGEFGRSVRFAKLLTCTKSWVTVGSSYDTDSFHSESVSFREVIVAIPEGRNPYPPANHRSPFHPRAYEFPVVVGLMSFHTYPS